MDAWYSVLSMGFGYLAAAVILIMVILSIREIWSDRRAWKKVRREKNQVCMAGEMRIVSGGKKMTAGAVIGIPYEGTLGSAARCDIVLYARRLHMRSAIFRVNRGMMVLVPLQRDKFIVDGVPVNPGEEAVMISGALLQVGDVSLKVTLYDEMDGGPEAPVVSEGDAQLGMRQGKEMVLEDSGARGRRGKRKRGE